MPRSTTVTRRRRKQGNCSAKAARKLYLLAGIAEEESPNLRYISFDIYFPADEGVTIDWTACICGHCHVCQQAASKTGLSHPRRRGSRLGGSPHIRSRPDGEPDLQLVA